MDGAGERDFSVVKEVADAVRGKDGGPASGRAL